MIFDIKMGSLSYNGNIEKPTIITFNNWLNEVKTQAWYNNYDFWLVGNFARHLGGDALHEDTWDIDILMLKKDENPINAAEVEEALLYCTNKGFEYEIFIDIYLKDIPNTKFFNMDENFGINADPYKMEFCDAYSVADQFIRDGVVLTEFPVQEQIGNIFRRKERVIPLFLWRKWQEMNESGKYIGNIHLNTL